ncbi:MAG: pyrimidine dimer DNA glycosylase/endonuclease V [Myxococcota bacterium]|nr:pyrimidine dimer DNA glycosylase/endonuclease V [Myxococcota bacterium]
MRLWSLHPEHLDSKGLVALWREGLLARKVLRGETRGYLRHPQLERFRATASPERSIDVYLHHVVDEADKRGFRFDRSKLGRRPSESELEVTSGQLAFEREHLKKKLDVRDPARSQALPESPAVAPHPLFQVIDGPIASWERP